MKQLLAKALAWLKKQFAPGFEATKIRIIGQIDWAIQAVPGVGVSTVIDTLKNRITDSIASAHLPGPASMLAHIALASVDWHDLAQKPASWVVAELKALRQQIQEARL